MKNKLAYLFVTLVLLLNVICLTSCGEASTETGHNDDTTSQEVQCTHNGLSDEYFYNSTHHWKECESCGSILEKERHSFEETIVEPTQNVQGYTLHTCSVCGYSYKDNYTELENIYYTVVFKNYDGEVLQTSSVKKNGIPTYNKSNPTKDNDDNYSYTFIGWNPTITKATEDKVYTATYRQQLLPYSITIDLDGGSSAQTKLQFRTDNVSKEILPFDVQKKGYAFNGYELNNVKVYDEKGNTVNSYQPSENMTFKAIYEEAVTLSIFYTIYNPKTGQLLETFNEKPSSVANVSETRSYEYNTYVDLFAYAKEGYTFVGWYNNGQVLSNDKDYKHMMWNEDFTIEARFKCTLYDLNVWSNNEELGQVMIRNSNSQVFYNEETLKEYYTESVTIVAYSKTDTRFLGWYNEKNELVSTNAVYTFNMLNRDYNLEAKWNSFNIKYNIGENSVIDGNNPTNYNIDLENLDIPYEPRRYGYTFIGWEFNGNMITEIDSLNACHMTITAIWKEQKELEPFEFTSSVANQTITITGVKDKTIVSIEIPSIVTNIGNFAFASCTELTNITIPNSVTSIGDSAFANCSSLTSIVIPNSVTSIGLAAFNGCSSLEAMTIPFIGDKNHTATDKYQYPFGYIFGSSNYDGGIKTKQYYYGSSTSSTTSSDYYIPSTLKEVVIAGVGYIPYGSFYNCSSLTNVIISSYVTGIGQGAFSGCSSLESMTIPFVGNKNHTATDKYQYPFGYIFGTTSYNDSIKINQSYYGSSTSSTTSSDYYIPLTLKEVIIDGASHIPYGSFYNCSSLTSIEISDSVISLGDHAFWSCSSLTSIEIPDSVTSIGGWTFVGCSSLTSVGIPSGLISIDANAFYNCDSLENVYYNGTIEALCNIASAIGNFNSIHQVNNIYILDEKGIIEYYGNKYSLLEELAIPNTLTEISNYQFIGFGSLKSIVIPSNVTSIGQRAFSNCSSLENVYYNGTIENWCNIKFSTRDSNPMYYANDFYILDENGIIEYNGNKYSLLKELTIPNSLTGISNYQFYGFNLLTSITLFESVTSVGVSTFDGCSSLENVYYNGTIENWCNIEFSSITSNPMCYANNFYILKENGIIEYNGNKYSLLEDLTIPSTLTEINKYQFYGFNILKSIIVPSSVTSIGIGAFGGCSSIESMTIPFVGNKNHTATDIVDKYPFGHIFGTANYNGSIKIVQTYYGTIISGGISTPSITSLDYYIPSTLKEVIIEGTNYIPYGSFSNCSSLTSIELSNSVTSIGEYAFSGCSSLTSVELPNSVTSIGEGAFQNCRKLATIEISKNLTSIESNAFYGCISLENVYYNGTNENWCNILFSNKDSNPMYYANNFYILDENGMVEYNGNEYSLLEEIIIPNSVTRIEYQFYGFNNLINIVIPNSVTSISEAAFNGCSSLESITIPFVGDKKHTATDTYQYPFGYIFGKEIYDGGITLRQDYYESSVSSPSYSTYCIPSTLKEVIVEGSSYIPYGAFQNCSFLTSIVIPNSVVSIGGMAFNGCSLLESIDIPNGVISIGEYTFEGCSSLESIIIPNSVIDIGKYAFYHCDALTSITIPKSVTSIGEHTFTNCNSLTSIVILGNVTSIGAAAFYGCSSLENVYYGGSAEEWESINIDISNEPLISSTVYNYSEEAPENVGNYWHYVNDEIVIWG